MKRLTTVDANSSGGPDFIARYFLRRLAMAHRESPSRKPSIQYSNALLETILIFVGLPMLGIASLILIPSLRWAPNTTAKWLSASPWGDVLVVGILSLVVGHLCFGKRFKKYREDRSAYTQFASTRDARIVFWQRFIVFIICAVVLPLLAMLVTFGKQVITRAFDLQ
jgi:succinate dehydrogenase/fumarate reductase cytochrome b subunit